MRGRDGTVKASGARRRSPLQTPLDVAAPRVSTAAAVCPMSADNQQQFQGELWVLLQQGEPGRLVHVMLHENSTAFDVLRECVGDNLADGWSLVADIDGYEKRFVPSERLYQLLRKHLRAAGGAQQRCIRFYARRRKKLAAVTAAMPLSSAPQRTGSPVRLLASSDSVTAMPPAAQRCNFAPSRMSRQPVRVPQPPPVPVATATASTAGVGRVNGMQQLTYNELLELAEQQRRQIEGNRREIEEKEARLRAAGRSAGGIATAARLRNLRHQVAVEETELTRLGQMQRDTELRQREAAAARMELARLQHIFSAKEIELRTAAGKVESLRSQLDELHRRRESAASMAFARQEQLKKSTNPSITNENDLTRTSSSASVESRPRAAVEPFQVSLQIVRPSNLSITAEKKPASISSPDSPATTTTNERPHGPPPPPPPPPPIGQSKVAVVQTRESPSPPGDPAPTPVATTVPSNIPVIHRPPQQSINVRLRTHNVLEELKALAMEAPPADLLGSDRYDQVETDKLALRNDTLRAAKRRSWAQQDAHVHDETENIKRVLIQEQLKGKTHINFSDIFNTHESPMATVDIISPTIEEEKTPIAKEIDEVVRPPPPYERVESMNDETNKDNKAIDEVEESEKTGTEEEEAVAEVEIVVDEETLQLIKPNPDKGILKMKPTSNYRREKRNIEFDPLALLLDAALEGELDLVMASAAKMPDVSRCNDEGITALHNAICAGHYEIVRFLVEKHADVNAQDSDGWTPLHCAASCNNLPVVKFLVERGGCVFASTLSDQETPADKCEEEEDGYDGCIQYLMAVKNAMGRLADRIVYAAYSFDGENEDELSFEEGSALRVETREGEENLWWLCTDIGSSRTGLVPRNYLALYPRLKHAHLHSVPVLDLSVRTPDSPEANNNTVKSDEINKDNDTP